MHSQNIFRYLLLFLSITIHSAQLAAGGFPAMPGQGPSLDDIKAMEQEIDNFVRNLPPEQQKQFYKDVEELTGIMEKMSPDELNEFVGGVFSDAGLIEPAPAAKPTQQPTPANAVPKEEAKPSVVITTAPSAPSEKAINMISAIIKRTEEFMRKAQIIPELQVKMNKWVVQKKLLDVAANLDWEVVENQIDELNVLLYSLREKDHKTGQYKHIGNLIKDEALYNNLATLQVTLEAYVPLIYAPDFGTDSVSKESRAAIREVLSQYLESFYLLNIPAAIKKVKLLYEPRAKELTEEEKKAAELAKKDAEKTRTAAPATKSPGTRAPYTPTQYSSSYDRGSNDYGYYPTSYGSPYDYDTTPSYSSGSSGRAPSTKGGAATVKGEEKGGSKAAEGGKEVGAGSGEKTSGAGAAGGAKAKEEIVLDTKTEIKLGRLEETLVNGLEALNAFKDDFKKLYEDFTTGKDLDINSLEARAKAIEDTNKFIKKFIEDIKNFKKNDLKSLNKTMQDHYKKQLGASLAKTDAVKFYKTLNYQIKQCLQALGYPDVVQKVGKNKLYVYFGIGVSTDAEVQKKIEAAYKEPKDRISMKQLSETIDSFFKEAGI